MEQQKSKKFLPFSGRLAYRRNGLIDITSPADELAGFRATLKPGTDSYEVAKQALIDNNVAVPETPRDFYAEDLDANAGEGILIGVDDANKPLFAPLPGPDVKIWILGNTIESGTIKAIVYSRGLSLGAKDTYKHAVSHTVAGHFHHNHMATEKEAEAQLEQRMKDSPTSRGTALYFMFMEDISVEIILALVSKQKELKERKIMPVISHFKDKGVTEKDLVFVTSSSTGMTAENIPESREWHRNVPLGHAFVRFPGEHNFTRFRAM